jgi:hypothetical protein
MGERTLRTVSDETFGNAYKNISQRATRTMQRSSLRWRLQSLCLTAVSFFSSQPEHACRGQSTAIATAPLGSRIIELVVSIGRWRLAEPEIDQAPRAPPSVPP